MLRRNTLITLSAQVGIQLIGLVTGILVARFLGPSSRGELAAIIAWVAMLAYLGNLGLPIAYAYGAAREPQRISQLLGNGILATIAQWAAIALIGWAMLPLMLSAHNDQTFRLAILYLILFVPLNLLTLYSSAIQQGLGNYRKFNIVRLCVPVSYLAMLLVLVVLDRMTVAGVLVANVFSNLVALVMAVTLLIKLAWHQGRSYGFFDLKALGRDARYGISAHLGTLQPFSGLQIDILLLTLLLSARELGLYMAALAGAAVIKAQGVALGMVVMPETAKLCDNEEQRFLLLRFAAFTLLLGGMTAAVALIWAEPLATVSLSRNLPKFQEFKILIMPLVKLFPEKRNASGSRPRDIGRQNKERQLR